VYEIIFYQDAKGHSELLEFIEMLNTKAASSKNERIMLKQIRFYINILENLGTMAGEPFVKHIQDEVWEIRPGYNRILFFTWYNNKIVLLNYFRKTTNKTPKSEIEKAINEIKDWKGRNDQNG
jgi:phage-related protein